MQDIMMISKWRDKERKEGKKEFMVILVVG